MGMLDFNSRFALIKFLKNRIPAPSMNFLLTSCFQTNLVSFSEVTNITGKKGQKIDRVGISTVNTCCWVHLHLYNMWEVEILSKY